MSAPNLRRYMAVIDARITDIQQKLKDGTSSALLPTRHYHDDLCLALLCRAIIQRELRLPLDSLDTFLQLLSHEDSVTLDHYIVPFGRYELAKLYLGMRPPMLKEARAELDAVKRDYKKYSLESNLHFRVHNAMHHVNVLERRVSAE